MFQTDDLAIDHFKDVPGFKGLLKAVLKHQIQVLVEQLAKHADEETIVLSASVMDGGLSYLGSVAAKDFLEEKEDIKIQFLRHCITKRHRATTQVNDYSPFSASNAFISGQFDQHTYSPPVDHNMHHAEQPTRHKARKLSHPQHIIKPARQYQESYSNEEQCIDLTNHAVRNSRHRSQDRDHHTSSPVHRKKHLTPPKQPPKPPSPQISIVKVESIAGEDLTARFEEDVETMQQDNSSNSRHAGTSVESEGNSDSLPTDLSREREVYEEESDQQSYSSDMFRSSVDADTNGTGGQGEDTTAGKSEIIEQQGVMFDQLPGVTGLVNPAAALRGVSQVYSYRSQPQSAGKKRVYRKVECDICHKLIYITNIKVHKLRHMKNSLSVG